MAVVTMLLLLLLDSEGAGSMGNTQACLYNDSKQLMKHKTAMR